MKEYERAPSCDCTAGLIVLLIVALAFSAFLAFTEKPENCFDEAAAETIYKLKN